MKISKANKGIISNMAIKDKNILGFMNDIRETFLEPISDTFDIILYITLHREMWR